MKSVSPSDVPSFTPAQAHLGSRTLIGTCVPLYGAGP